MNIQSLPLLFAILLLSACQSGQETSSSASRLSAGDEEVLRNFKTVLWPKAYAEQDTALLNKMLHAEFELVDDNGDTFSKQDEMDYVSGQAPSYDAFVFEITRLDLFENGTAVITGIGTMQGEDADGPYTTTYKSSNVVVKVGEEWQAINSHVSGVKEERPE